MQPGLRSLPGTAACLPSRHVSLLKFVIFLFLCCSCSQQPMGRLWHGSLLLQPRNQPGAPGGDPASPGPPLGGWWLLLVLAWGDGPGAGPDPPRGLVLAGEMRGAGPLPGGAGAVGTTGADPAGSVVAMEQQKGNLLALVPLGTAEGRGGAGGSLFLLSHTRVSAPPRPIRLGLALGWGLGLHSCPPTSSPSPEGTVPSPTGALPAHPQRPMISPARPPPPAGTRPRCRVPAEPGSGGSSRWGPRPSHKPGPNTRGVTTADF